jgi:hypothetical protein
MNYIDPRGECISVFAVCQAHAQLESDYNVGGILRERPSNQRRNESTGCQLARMGYSNPYGWTDICAEPDDGDDPDDEAVRYVYLSNVMKLGLPADDGMRAAINRMFASGWLQENYPMYYEPGRSCTTEINPVNGAVTVSDIRFGRLISMTYYGYSVEEAIEEFSEYIEKLRE